MSFVYVILTEEEMFQCFSVVFKWDASTTGVCSDEQTKNCFHTVCQVEQDKPLVRKHTSLQMCL